MKNLVTLILCLALVPAHAQQLNNPKGNNAAKPSAAGLVNGGVVVNPNGNNAIPKEKTGSPPVGGAGTQRKKAYSTQTEPPQKVPPALKADVPLPPSTTSPVSHGQNLIGKALTGNVSEAPLTAAEVKAMPHACITIGMGRIDGLFWAEAMNRNKTLHLLDLPENAMAKDAPWFHHYCWAQLSKLRSISAMDAQKRQQEINIWRDNLEFIVDANEKRPSKWGYLPQVFTEMAESYLLEKKYAQALAMADKARALNPRHADAYTVIADSQSAIGNKQKALAAVTEGLRYAPASKGMKRRYKALGGVEPYPEPYADSAQTVTQPSKDPEVAALPPKEQAASPNQAAASAPALEERPTPPPAEAPVGSPTNPYCRFCP